MEAAGYRIELFYLWLPGADLAVARVANRVSQSGHGVPGGIREFPCESPELAAWVDKPGKSAD